MNVDLLRRIKHLFFPYQNYVFGDSHTDVFNHLNLVYGKKTFHVNRVDGATALGMVNPNSKTNALPTYMKTIALLPKKSKLIFLLGEVDVGFLLWHRYEELNVDIETEVNKSVNNYIQFLNKLFSLGYSNIQVLSPTPPCVMDEFKEIQKNELRRKIRAGIKERTALAIKYNNLLKSKLSGTKISFVDLYDVLIDKSTGIVDTKYVSNDSTEHHLDMDAMGKLIIDRIK